MSVYFSLRRDREEWVLLLASDGCIQIVLRDVDTGKQVPIVVTRATARLLARRINQALEAKP